MQKCFSIGFPKGVVGRFQPSFSERGSAGISLVQYCDQNKMTDGLKRGDGEEAGLRKKLGPFYEAALFACTYTIDYCNVRKRTLGE